MLDFGSWLVRFFVVERWEGLGGVVAFFCFGDVRFFSIVCAVVDVGVEICVVRWLEEC